ncbi:MAG: patatin-like phospholipase family protein [Acidobacteria bacterium]|nr:patatin-like phospholipase family protein [Acidobacteriota bacterium]
MLNTSSSSVTKPVFAAMVLLLMAGCSSVHRKPVPIDKMDSATIPGMPGIRDWSDRPSRHFQEDLVQAVRDGWATEASVTGDHPVNVLVLSGGGSNGAFGAGFLNGWSESGTRPVFKLVTGISTGALTAPYAFLGPDYDDELETVFTNVTNKDIYTIRNPLVVFKKDSLATTKPLARKIEEVVTAELLAAIAEEHSKGRRLFVATTNLDTQRLVVWNMGAIAASGHPGSLELFRSVLLASSSIPVAFPPVYFEVEVDGERYDEMHVDGGVMAELFLWGAMVDIAEATRQLQVDQTKRPEVSIYVIRNGQIDASIEQVRPNLVNIATRSMITLLKSVATADLLRIWALSERHGIDFNYVGIPHTHSEATVSAFNPAEMRRLFDLGRELALAPGSWRSDPPPWVQ